MQPGSGDCFWAAATAARAVGVIMRWKVLSAAEMAKKSLASLKRGERLHFQNSSPAEVGGEEGGTSVG